MNCTAQTIASTPQHLQMLAKQKSILKKAIATNVNGVKILLENTNRYNCLLHLSTDYVFDGQQSHPYLESDPVNPINIYGKTKAEGEQILLALAEKYYIVRTAWLYAKTHGQNFYRSILHKASAGKTLSVVNDQIGPPHLPMSLLLF